ncbi:MAG TPA: DUF1631 domain-containing protein [Usitatibacteraceae bacterium]|nr:DUF1631 domain-containing protein [Usitatibacteraceae bacterium]
MANTSSGNVVSLDARARARARLTPQESASVLHDCRELALGRIVQALSGVLDRVEDELFKLAEQSQDRDSQNLCLDARAQAREHRPHIEAAFRRQFLAFFNRKVKNAPRESREEPEPQALALLGDEELEQALAVQAMASRLKSACEGELAALSQRFGFLLERPDLADEGNPVSPEAVSSALKDACDQIEAGWKVRHTLLRALEEQVSGELGNVYHDLNALFVARQILPEIRPTFRRNPPSPAKGAAASGSGAGTAPAAATAAADIYAVLAQLLGAVPAPAGATTAAGIAAPLPAAGSAPVVSPATRGFVQSLTGMQQPGQALAGNLANVIREIRASPQSAALGGVDAMTIDLVAMLFDFVFEDRQIPAVVKAVLGRLQIPTLKVALLDRAFFSSRAHPARALLDRLARASIGMDESSARGEATLTKLEEVVGRVLREFDDNIALFATLSAEMDAFLAKQDQAEEAIAQRTASLVESRERFETARLLAEAEIDRRLAARAWVPVAVRDLLEGTWTLALANAHVELGEGSATWVAMLALVDELLWSVESKTEAGERRRMVAGIPALVRGLQEGMARAGLDEARREAFLGLLVDCHADAVRAGLKGIALQGQPPEGRPAKARVVEAQSIEREVVPAGDIEVEEIRLRTPRGQPPVRNVFTRTGIWTNVERYTWVEFRREGARQPLRARLTWISPAKGVYLFTNSTAGVAISVSPEALAEQMRRGEARIVDDSPLVDRAVDSMLASLRERAA